MKVRDVIAHQLKVAGRGDGSGGIQVLFDCQTHHICDRSCQSDLALKRMGTQTTGTISRAL